MALRWAVGCSHLSKQRPAKYMMPPLSARSEPLARARLRRGELYVAVRVLLAIPWIRVRFQIIGNARF